MNKLFIKYIVNASLVILLLTACQEEIVLNSLPNSPDKLVIEGLVTNQDTSYWVRLSGNTNSYYNTNDVPIISDAQVDIFEKETNTTYSLTFNDQTNRFETEAFIGQVGNTYTLQVHYKSEIYEASGILKDVPPTEELYYKYLENNSPPFFEPGYYVFYKGTIPDQEEFYYRFKIYENDSLYNEAGDYLVFDNDVVSGSLDVNLGYKFDLQDIVLVEMYSLNRDMYDYYQELTSLLGNDGGLFSPPPVNPTSNIKNITNPENNPMGFFQVSAVASDKIVIE